ncbi:dihydrofolate reductase family protein [Leifsonia xyli]|nr:dihydrofolate reductase family protein [Leifsonia xyli]
MGTITVHEFVSLDGVFEDPGWTAEHGFDPAMGEDLARITGSSDAILLGRRTFEVFAPVWSARTAEDDPGAPSRSCGCVPVRSTATASSTSATSPADRRLVLLRARRSWGAARGRDSGRAAPVRIGTSTLSRPDGRSCPSFRAHGT